MRPNCDIDRETTVELYDAYVLDASVLEDVFRRANAFLDESVSVERLISAIRISSQF
jgi:hypothetical protein